MVERLKAAAARAAAPEGTLGRAPARDHAHCRGPLYLRLAMPAWHDRPPMRAGSTSMLGQTLGGTRLFVRGRCKCGGSRCSRNRPSEGAEPPRSRPNPITTHPRAITQRLVEHAPHCLLQCARRCRPRGAPVGALSSRCDAAALGADRAGQLRPRRYYFCLRSPSASTPPLLWSTSGPIRSPPALAPAGPG